MLDRILENIANVAAKMIVMNIAVKTATKPLKKRSLRPRGSKISDLDEKHKKDPPKKLKENKKNSWDSTGL
jgi:hypothetical protein